MFLIQVIHKVWSSIWKKTCSSSKSILGIFRSCYLLNIIYLSITIVKISWDLSFCIDCCHFSLILHIEFDTSSSNCIINTLLFPKIKLTSLYNYTQHSCYNENTEKQAFSRVTYDYINLNCTTLMALSASLYCYLWRNQTQIPIAYCLY